MEIGAVVVTYNRIEKLKKALLSFAEMSKLPKYLLVIDNASTDGTKEYLDRWVTEDEGFKKLVTHMNTNTGGSGGFYEGLRQSLNLDADWTWVSDDDAYPDKQAFERASEYLDEHKDERISAVCAKVLKNGQLDVNHSKGYVKSGIHIKEVITDPSFYETKKEFDLYSLTYVGAIMKKKALEAVGLPNKDYFIYWDDLEHGLRMREYGRIVCVPAITAYHDVGKEVTSAISWRLYYTYRNMTDTYRKHFSGACFNYFAFKVRLKIFYNHITGQRNLKLNLLEAGFKDAMNGKFGLHKLYRPGWKPIGQDGN